MSNEHDVGREKPSTCEGWGWVRVLGHGTAPSVFTKANVLIQEKLLHTCYQQDAGLANQACTEA